MALAIDFFHRDTFLSPCLHHWALGQNQLDCVYVVSSFASAFVRILSCSALTLCHIHYDDSFIPLSTDFVVRTVSHYFVLSTFNMFFLVVRKRTDKWFQGYHEIKLSSSAKILNALANLTLVWFSKNVQVLSVRIFKISEASNTGLLSKTILSDCTMPFFTLSHWCFSPLVQCSSDSAICFLLSARRIWLLMERLLTEPTN